MSFRLTTNQAKKTSPKIISKLVIDLIGWLNNKFIEIESGHPTELAALVTKSSIGLLKSLCETKYDDLDSKGYNEYLELKLFGYTFYFIQQDKTLINQ